MGLVWDGGAERADPRGGHGVVVSGDGRRPALVGGVPLRLRVVVHVLLLGRVAFWRQAEVRPQLWTQTDDVMINQSINRTERMQFDYVNIEISECE